MDDLNQEFGIAVFVKTPGLSPIKTRLAAGSDQTRAENIYRWSVDKLQALLLRLMNERSDVKVYWAVAEKEAIGSNYWTQFTCLLQGEGGLGDRLFCVQKQLFERHQKVLILGSDMPFFAIEDIDYAMNNLDCPAGQVLFPAVDGGFVLYGSSLCTLASVWDQVEYSRADTRSQLEKRLPNTNHLISSQPFRDIDEWSDVKYYARQNLIPRELL